MPLARTKRKPAKASHRSVAPISVVLRLKPVTAGMPKRASLERQLNGEERLTQQDIVGNLLELWLHDQEYLD